jgi:hypothetical protein
MPAISTSRLPSMAIMISRMIISVTRVNASELDRDDGTGGPPANAGRPDMVAIMNTIMAIPVARRVRELYISFSNMAK